MKRSLIITGLMLVVLLLVGSVAGAVSPVTIFINGQEVVSDTPAQLINNRVMVPLRVVAEALGAEVKWLETSHRVLITTKPQQAPLPLLKLDGDQTSWPYWYEKEQLYLEHRNAVELIREAKSSPNHSIVFFPRSATLAFDGKTLYLGAQSRGIFQVVSLNYLRALGYLDYKFDPSTGNLTIIR